MILLFLITSYISIEALEKVVVTCVTAITCVTVMTCVSVVTTVSQLFHILQLLLMSQLLHFIVKGLVLIVDFGYDVSVMISWLSAVTNIILGCSVLIFDLMLHIMFIRKLLHHFVPNWHYYIIKVFQR